MWKKRERGGGEEHGWKTGRKREDTGGTRQEEGKKEEYAWRRGEEETSSIHDCRFRHSLHQGTDLITYIPHLMIASSYVISAHFICQVLRKLNQASSSHILSSILRIPMPTSIRPAILQFASLHITSRHWNPFP